MKHRRQKKQKLLTKFLLIQMLIIFFSMCLFSMYGKYASHNLVQISKIKIDKLIKNILSTKIDRELLNKENLNDIIVINKTQQGEILFVDYNLESSYNLLDLITNELLMFINDIELGSAKYFVDKNIFIKNNNLVLSMPFFVNSNNILLSAMGPKIYAKVSFVGTVLTNLKTKLTNYGMNNALLEMYVTIQISYEIISPVTKSNNVINYDVLIGSKVINGRVPEFYGGILENKSSIQNKNIID